MARIVLSRLAAGAAVLVLGAAAARAQSVHEVQAGESVFFWLKTMTFVNANSYPGSVLPGIYRGKEIWLHRYE